MHELRVPIDPVQGARHDVLPCRVDRPGEGFHPIGPRARPRRRPPRCLHHLVSHAAKEEGIGLDEVLDRVTMQVFVCEHGTMIAAPIDGISKGSHSTVAANAQEGIVWGGGSAQLFNLTVTGSTLGYGIVPEPMGSVYF